MLILLDQLKADRQNSAECVAMNIRNDLSRHIYIYICISGGMGGKYDWRHIHSDRVRDRGSRKM